MEIAAIIGFVILLALLNGGKKGPRKSQNSGNDTFRLKVVIEESGKSTPKFDQGRQKPALYTSSYPSPSELDASQITHGLIIAEPWIGKILSGEKIWEMRSRNTKRRGPIALIKKGSKTVVGICRLDGVKGPLDKDELAQYEHEHQVPREVYEAPGYKWYYAWMLSDVMPLPEPVPYVHPSGSVIWVTLAPQVIHRLADEAAPEPPSSNEGFRSGDSNIWSNDTEMTSIITVPYARDGSFFCRKESCIAGKYIVQGKQDTQEFSDYDEALDYLRNMAVARWGRPLSANEYEIVSAVEWRALIED